MRIAANPDFETYAKGFSGIDGGNLDSPIWLCGIEPGLTMASAFKFQDVSKAPEVSRTNFLKYPYDYRLVKLLSAIADRPLVEYRSFFIKEKVFERNGLGFKLNLYPLSFKDSSHVHWNQFHSRLTGLPTKGLYEAWCQIYRFSVFQEWLAAHQPKAIVCNGISDYLEFSLAFSRADEFHNPFGPVTQERDYPKVKEVNGGKTLLFLTPFLGKGGLVSNDSIDATGKIIGEACRNRFGGDWLGIPKGMIRWKRV